MKKVININFQGTVVPIEETSYELLKQYIESLRGYFANEEGRDEIINDIESRISELFQERLKKGSTCITDDDVNAIIKNMGRPQDFEEADGGEQNADAKGSQKEEHAFQDMNWKGKRLYRDENNKILGGVCSGIAAYFGIDPVIVRVLFIVSGIGFFLYILLWIFVPGSNMLVNGVRKRLYRNPDGKIIGGVCSGMGSYFNVNPWLPRFIFLIPFISFFFRWGHIGPLTFPNFLSFSFSPGTFIIYIILWLVIPEANTTAEKLEMKGEKVDLNSIKNSVVEEMKGVKERVNKLGIEAGNIAKERGAQMGQEIHYAAKRTSGALGNIIVTLFKVFAYFVLGCIAVGLIIGLFALAVVSIGIFPPLKNFILMPGWQTVLAWGTLIFFIAVPVIGIITFIIRRIARIKTANRIVRYSFIALWILGIACFISLISLVSSDFRTTSSIIEEPIPLSNASVKSLQVNSFNNNRYYRYDSWLRFEPFQNVDDDTAYIANVNVKLEKSATDSFHVSIIKMSNGSNRLNADKLASLINFNISQADSVLYIDRAIAINTTDKFRNQNVQVIISVPVGHYIKVNENSGWYHRVVLFDNWNNDNWYWDDNDLYYKTGEQYIMKEDGLYTLDGIPASKEDDYRNKMNSEDDDNNNFSNAAPQDSSYRYNKHDKIDSLTNAQEKEMKKLQSSVDSLKREKEKENKRIKDSLQKVKETLDQKIEKLDGKSNPTQAYLGTGKQYYTFVMHI